MEPLVHLLSQSQGEAEEVLQIHHFNLRSYAAGSYTQTQAHPHAHFPALELRDDLYIRQD